MEKTSTSTSEYGDDTSLRTRRITTTVRVPAKYKNQDKSLTLTRLDEWYKIVKSQILQHQSYTTGLYPRYSNDKNLAYVKDSLYCALACVALAAAYTRMDDDRGRQYELGQSAVKTMRGILSCWMLQADKIEAFKKNASPVNALHSTFNLMTGEPLLSHSDYGHLQIDVVALYLLCLVEMISGGLEIIFTPDEVNFIQNIVFYVERAYRTPDFGIWEQGTRYNDGTPELHASSLGMVKAVLEAINGFNCYGSKGTSASVIYVDIDAHNRNRTTFETLLPRESASKNTDASLLLTIGFPFFSTHDPKIYHRTMEKCIRRLRGNYGFKRFLRDGKKSVIEDKSRRFYTPGETKLFDGVESQWPLFYLYLIIEGCFMDNEEQIKKYWDFLNPVLLHDENGRVVVPECYYHPEDVIFQERCTPGSQTMSPHFTSDDGLFLWGQSLYIIAGLLTEHLIIPSEIDPIYRHLPASQRPKVNNRHSVFQGSVSDPVVQVALIAESTKLQTTLLTYGIQAQTPHQVEPVQIWSPNEMVKLLELIGKNDRLMLSGRPPRPIGALGTSKIYQIFGDTVISYGILFEMNDFYMSFDPAILIDDIKKDLKFISQRWKLGGRPTFCFLMREDNVSGAYFSQMLDLLVSIKNGNVDGVRVRVGRVQNLLSAGCVEHLDFPISIKAKFIVKPLREVSSDIDLKGSLQDISKASQSYMMDSDFNIDTIKIKSTEELVHMYRNVPVASLYTQTQFLRLLLERHGPHYRIEDTTTVRDKLEKICRQAALGKNWFVVRLCAGLLGKTVDSLAPSITSILVRGKKVTVGVFGHEEKIIEKPVTPDEVAAYIYSTCSPYDISLAVLEQELIIALGHYTTAEPQLFTSILKIRIGWIIHAIDLLLNYESGKKTVSVTCLSPTEVKQILRDILSMKRFSRLSNVQQRQLNGSLGRVPPDFYERIWKVVAKTPEGIIVDGHHLPQQPTLSDMTEYELTFAFTVDELLGNIAMPEYRQIMVEAFMVVSLILERNSELQFTRALNMDNIIFDAIDTFQKEKRALNMENTNFYDLPCSGRKGSAAYLARAVVNDLFSDNTVTGGAHDSHCALS